MERVWLEPILQVLTAHWCAQCTTHAVYLWCTSAARCLCTTVRLYWRLHYHQGRTLFLKLIIFIQCSVHLSSSWFCVPRGPESDFSLDGSSRPEVGREEGYHQVGFFSPRSRKKRRIHQGWLLLAQKSASNDGRTLHATGPMWFHSELVTCTICAMSEWRSCQNDFSHVIRWSQWLTLLLEVCLDVV